MAQYTRASGSVALITLQNPPVNALSAAVRQGLVDTIQRAQNDPEVTAVVICGQNGRFCGGADIREFAGPMSGPPLLPTFHAVEEGKPVVAAIEGVALGGGLELALFCHYRIAHSKARLGLPEVTLGLLPAAGGSQRLPRLIGVPAALDLIVTGRHVSAAEALELGIVDQVTDENARDLAVKFAQSVSGKPLDSRRLSERSCVPPPDVDAFFEEQLASVRRRARGAVAPVACVEAVRAAATLPYARGMERERELMATLFQSDQARALQYCFLSQRAAGKWTLPCGARWDNTAATPVHTAAVIGLGTMGRGIAVALALAGVSVVGVETQQQQLAEARAAVPAMLERASSRRRGGGVASGALRFTSDLAGEVGGVDLVVEAVFEDAALKERLFRQLGALCRRGTLLCTNTSSLDVDRLAGCCPAPELVLGLHFFAPAHVMPLLEVVRGPRCSPVAVATAMTLARRMGKVGVAVGNCPGFVGNRLLRPYLDQAHFLLEEGATPRQVDGALEGFGMAMGALRMSDLSGLDVGWRVRKGEGLVMAEESRKRGGRRYSPLPDLLCEAGRLGQKTGRGWYAYDDGRQARPDPWTELFLDEYRARHGLTARAIGPDEVLERCLYALANEGFRALGDGAAAGPKDVDAIYVNGYGWPPHRGGPLFHAAAVGLDRVLRRLEQLSREQPDVPGMEPCALLRRLVEAGSPPLNQWRGVVRGTHSQL